MVVVANNAAQANAEQELDGAKRELNRLIIELEGARGDSDADRRRLREDNANLRQKIADNDREFGSKLQELTSNYNIELEALTQERDSAQVTCCDLEVTPHPGAGSLNGG